MIERSQRDRSSFSYLRISQGDEKVMSNFLTVQDMADRYGRTKATIRNWRIAGRIPQGMKISRERIWLLDEIEAFEKTRGVKGVRL